MTSDNLHTHYCYGFSQVPEAAVCRFLQNRCLLKKFIRKETPTQVFSCEYCKISKNSFFIEHLQWLLLKYYQTTVVLMEPTPLQLGTGK